MTDREVHPLPPGPKPWPLLGNIPFLLTANGELYEVGVDLKNQYGDLVTLVAGSSTLILVMGYEKFRALTVDMDDKLGFRPTNVWHIEYLFKGKGLFFGNGEQHASLKKVAYQAFKDSGVGSRTLEDRIQEEAHAMCEDIATHGDQARDLTRLYRQAVINVIASLAYGQRYDYKDPGMALHVETTEKLALVFSSRQIENTMHCLVNFPFSKVAQAASATANLKSHIQLKVVEHRESFKADTIRDFIDLCIQLEPQEKELTEENLLQLILDFYIGGTDTSMVFYIWATLYLIVRPELQTKCREELVQAVGDRAVSLKDKAKMPFLQAFIYEVLRITSIASYTAPHSPQQDLQVDGFTIPKDSYVLFNVYSVGRDPKVWVNPEEFRPERFLSDTGELLPLKEEFVTFGLGSRSCLGKHLILMESFIFLGTLLQKFELRSPPNTPPPCTKMSIVGFTPQPKPFKVCCIPMART